MNRGQLPKNSYLPVIGVHSGAFDHASHAPQLLADNYYIVQMYYVVVVVLYA